MSASNRVYMFDTTLRDGAQTVGVDMSVHEKQIIAQLLDEFGMDYIEGGYPGANPVDTEFFSAKSDLKKSVLVAFGKTAAYGRSPQNDPALSGLFNSSAGAVCLVGKSSPRHVKDALGITLSQNLESIEKSMRAFVDSGRNPMLDLEHAFDGFKENPDYLLEVLRAAQAGGAQWMVLCDTNGGSMPQDVERTVKTIVDAGINPDTLGVHTHNDCELAVANSMAAVDAGVRMVQGTINGIGERCGNANLMTLIPNLMKLGYDCGVTQEQLKGLRALSRAVSNTLDLPDNPSAAYVGDNAFATKAGIHASAILKDPSLYEHVPPDMVGNKRNVIGGSAQSGMSNLKSKLEEMGIDYNPNDSRWSQLVETIKEREACGYAYDQADASLEILIHRAAGTERRYFELLDYDVTTVGSETGPGAFDHSASARVKVLIGNRIVNGKADGKGPVHALDNALRPLLASVYAMVHDVHLDDYKVRIVNAGAETEAITRVKLDCKNGGDTRWTTVGASTNIVNASAEALVDALRWKLQFEKVQDRTPEQPGAAFTGMQPR